VSWEFACSLKLLLLVSSPATRHQHLLWSCKRKNPISRVSPRLVVFLFQKPAPHIVECTATWPFFRSPRSEEDASASAPAPPFAAAVCWSWNQKQIKIEISQILIKNARACESKSETIVRQFQGRISPWQVGEYIIAAMWWIYDRAFLKCAAEKGSRVYAAVINNPLLRIKFPRKRVLRFLRKYDIKAAVVFSDERDLLELS